MTHDRRGPERFISVQISKMLVEKCIDNKLEEITETEFLKICSIDSDLGTVVIKVYRAFIGSWSFLYERWWGGQEEMVAVNNLHFTPQVQRSILHSDQTSHWTFLGQHERQSLQHPGEPHRHPGGGREEEEGGSGSS